MLDTWPPWLGSLRVGTLTYMQVMVIEARIQLTPTSAVLLRAWSLINDRKHMTVLVTRAVDRKARVRQ